MDHISAIIACRGGYRLVGRGVSVSRSHVLLTNRGEGGGDGTGRHVFLHTEGLQLTGC